MKRTPLHRNTAIKRSTSPIRRSRISPISANRRKGTPARKRCMAEVQRRSGGWCEAEISPDCKGWATQGHEKLPRSAGGSATDPANVLHVCINCHGFIHHNPAVAYAKGLLLSRYATAPP